LKERVTVTIDKELLIWIDKKVEEKVFANRSHGFEYLIKRKMDDEI
jgi:metal-responsive CopG/Arc/MetJ family transcriptional regulator